MTAAQEVRREYLERHARGQHHWQPGPYVSGTHPDTPATIVVVCDCGELRRVKLPSEIVTVRSLSALGRVPVPSDFKLSDYEPDTEGRGGT